MGQALADVLNPPCAIARRIARGLARIIWPSGRRPGPGQTRRDTRSARDGSRSRSSYPSAGCQGAGRRCSRVSCATSPSASRPSSGCARSSSGSTCSISITRAIGERQDLHEHLPGGGPQPRGPPAGRLRLRLPLRRRGRTLDGRAASARASQRAGARAGPDRAGADPHRRERPVALRARRAGLRARHRRRRRSRSRSGWRAAACARWWSRRCWSRARCSAC